MTRDELVRAVLERLAADDVGELLAGVRRDAHELVRRQLVDDYAAALVNAIASSGSVPPSGDDIDLTSRGCYVYAITAGVGASAATGERGIAPGGVVELLSVGEVAAVVSDVDVSAVRRGCDEADVTEDGWLANAVRAHDRVVAAAFRSAPTIPVRFGLVHPDRESLTRTLRAHQGELRSELDRLTGRAEWNVKVFVDLTTSATSYAAVDTPPTGRSSGAEFLNRERDRRAARARTELAARTVVTDAVQTLDSIAADRVDLKHSASGPGGAPYFAATYLVDHRHENAFVAAVERLRADADEAVTLTVDGPWPPFHFTSLRLEPDDE